MCNRTLGTQVCLMLLSPVRIQVLIHTVHKALLRWFGTPPSSDVLFIEINEKIKYDFINSFFSAIVIYNSVAQLVRGFTTDLVSYEFESRWGF